jgi:hypothetical protein
MSCRVVLVRTDVSEEHIASIIRIQTISVFFRSMYQLLVTADVVPSSQHVSAASYC